MNFSRASQHSTGYLIRSRALRISGRPTDRVEHPSAIPLSKESAPARSPEELTSARSLRPVCFSMMRLQASGEASRKHRRCQACRYSACNSSSAYKFRRHFHPRGIGRPHAICTQDARSRSHSRPRAHPYFRWPALPARWRAYWPCSPPCSPSSPTPTWPLPALLSCRHLIDKTGAHLAVVAQGREEAGIETPTA